MKYPKSGLGAFLDISGGYRRMTVQKVMKRLGSENSSNTECSKLKLERKFQKVLKAHRLIDKSQICVPKQKKRTWDREKAKLDT